MSLAILLLILALLLGGIGLFVEALGPDHRGGPPDHQHRQRHDAGTRTSMNALAAPVGRFGDAYEVWP